MLNKVLATMAATAICCSSMAMAADKLSKDEQVFLRMAAIANLKEIEMSKLAQEQAQDASVKQFAQMMVQDHTQATQQLKQLAKDKDVKLPNDLPKDEQEEVDALKATQGREFDQCYISAMKAQHLMDVSKFSDKAATAKDQDVRAFAAQATPILQQHTQQVMTLATAAGLPTITASGTAQPAGAQIGSDASGTSGATGATGASETSGSTSGTGSSDSGTSGAGAGATGVGASGNSQQTTGAQGGAPDTAGNAGQSR